MALRLLRAPSSIGDAVKAEQDTLAIDFCRRQGTCGFLLRVHRVLIGPRKMKGWASRARDRP